MNTIVIREPNLGSHAASVELECPGPPGDVDDLTFRFEVEARYDDFHIGRAR